MAHLFQQFREEILAALKTLQERGVLGSDLDFSKVTAEPPRESQHGDIASNAAMVLAKSADLPPRRFAEILAEMMKNHPHVTGIEIAGAGFINFTLSQEYWRQALQDILKAGTDYGTSTLGQGTVVNVEYVSANPTGPIHMGHCRVAVVGDTLANLLQKAGYTVIKEFYINDAGGQVIHLARSVYQRYLEALGYPCGELAYYRGDYLIPLGQELAQKYGEKWVHKDECEWLELFRHFAVDKMMERIKEDLAALNIHQDVFTSEKALTDAGKVDEVFELFKSKGLIYRGVLAPPKGKKVEDYEAREQDLFRSTAFGDDMDRPLKKSDGSWAYITPDIAYHLDKYQRGAKRMLLVLGGDHAGYISRLSAAVNALSDGQASVDIKICQIVKFIDNGHVLKMSKRAGNFVTVQEALTKVGRDAIRFMMVWRKNDAPLDFDFKKVTEQTRDNPVFYVQYAYARCHSIKRHAASLFPEMRIERSALAKADFSLITDPADFDIIKQLANWPRVVEAAAKAEEPHRIAYYLYDIASAFHALWNKGKEETELRFVIPHQPHLTFSRLALIEAVATVLESGLQILGVEAKQEMRNDIE